MGFHSFAIYHHYKYGHTNPKLISNNNILLAIRDVYKLKNYKAQLYDINSVSYASGTNMILFELNFEQNNIHILNEQFYNHFKSRKFILDIVQNTDHYESSEKDYGLLEKDTLKILSDFIINSYIRLI